MRSITTLCTRRVLHIATVLTVALHAAKAHLHSREAAQIEPIVVPPSGYWDGDEGRWSSFSVALGTPAQNIRMLISTSNSASWAVLPPRDSVCQREKCNDEEGTVFEPRNSSSWRQSGSDTYENNTCVVGTDDLRIGSAGNASGPILRAQTIVGCQTAIPSSISMLGLSPFFAGNSTNSSSLRGILQSLRSSNLIPTISANIDSTVIDMSLPREVCDVVESHFKLSYEEKLDMYFVNDSVHEELLQTQPSVTVTIGDKAIGGKTVNITIPYAAFDLGTSPLPRGTMRRFPLRRVQNGSLPTLGRVFLQEAYLTVDWEHGIFSISRARFDSPEKVVPIQPSAVDPMIHTPKMTMMPPTTSSAVLPSQTVPVRPSTVASHEQDDQSNISTHPTYLFKLYADFDDKAFASGTTSAWFIADYPDDQ
ncbi:aspartic peptidase domain-containing protein [Thermoascus aurantiacus ATCC 26904]